MKIPVVERILSFTLRRSDDPDDLTASTVASIIQNDDAVLLSPKELKEEARFAIDNNDDMNVTAIASLFGLSRQRIYQALAYDEENPTSGLDICEKILVEAGYSIDETAITLLRRPAD